MMEDSAMPKENVAVFIFLRSALYIQEQVSNKEVKMRLYALFCVASPCRLRFSNLTDKCCPALAAVLSTKQSYVRELDLGFNSISDKGVSKLVEALCDQNCRLKTIRLQGCGLTLDACQYVATGLTQSMKLQELDLSMNEIGDDGMRHLADGLGSPECQLKTLK